MMATDAGHHKDPTNGTLWFVVDLIKVVHADAAEKVALLIFGSTSA